jgi:DtxR family transcriptional regulator, Mn-dependent transcriptional regulator
MISQAVQDYLKTIYKLQGGGPVSTTEIARELKVSGASVTGMLKRLAGMGMVDYNSYKGVKLTNSGEKIALEIIRHHRLLELYLKEMLGFPLDKVHEEACRLEHYVSKDFVERITEILGNPEFDPHGHPIPSKNGELPETDEKSLVEVEAGKEVTISRLADNDSKMLAYFEELELMPLKKLMIIEKAPFNGPLTLKFGDQEKIIGNEVAKNIFVKC